MALGRRARRFAGRGNERRTIPGPDDRIPGRGGDRRAVAEAPGPLLGARLHRGRRGDWAVGAEARGRRRGGPRLRGDRHRAAAFSHRARVAAGAVVGAAPRRVRSRRRAGGGDRVGPRARSVGARRPAGRGRDRRIRAGAVIDRDRPADPDREEAALDPAGPRRIRGTAVPGPRGDPAPRGAAGPDGGACRGSACDGRVLAVGDDSAAGRGRGSRPLPAAPVFSRAGGRRQPGGLHRRRAAGGACGGRLHGQARYFDGARRLRRRHAARGLRVSPRDRGRHRAVQGAAAGALLHGGRHVGQLRPDRGRAAHDRRAGRGAGRAQGRRDVRARAGLRREDTVRVRAGGGAVPGRRIRVRAVFPRGRREAAARRRWPTCWLRSSRSAC